MSRTPVQRILIVLNDKWFVRRVAFIEHDGRRCEKAYRCDKHLGGPFDELDEAVACAKKVLARRRPRPSSLKRKIVLTLHPHQPALVPVPTFATAVRFSPKLSVEALDGKRRVTRISLPNASAMGLFEDTAWLRVENLTKKRREFTVTLEVKL